MRIVIILIYWFFASRFAIADIVNAASTSRADVQSAIDSAISGDTVIVPAGSSTWTTAVSVSGKNLTLQGNGIGSTNITDGTSGGALSISANSTDFVRVTGFTFIASGTHTSDGIIDISGTQADIAFRFDHNRILISSAVTRGIIVTSVYGLIDNTTFDITATTGSIQSVSVWGSSDSTDGGYTPWTRSLTLGSQNAVYVEDCTFNYTTAIAGTEDGIDGYGGGRIVIRNSSFTNVTVGFHGTDSGNRRSLHSFEIYDNTFTNNSSTTLRAATIRGGTGVIYGNTYGGSGSGWGGVTLMYYRACPPLDQSAWGTCDGTLWKLNSATLSSNGSRECSTSGTVGFNTTDKETLGTFGGAYQRYFDGPAANGYPGRDQPGITTGQVVDPIYVWSNDGNNAGTYDGGSPPAGGIEAYIESGRDYINNGTTAKPGYTALTYPHPLIGGSESNPTMNIGTFTIGP